MTDWTRAEQTHLGNEVEHGIAEEGGGPQSDEQGQQVLVVLSEAPVSGQWVQQQAHQGGKTHQHHHQEAIPIS